MTNVNVPMKANRMQKPIAKAARNDGLRQWSIVAAKGDCTADVVCIGLTREIVK